MTDFHFSTLDSSIADTAHAAWLDSWTLISITGQDSKSYLQGQLTCDVVSLSPGEVTWGAHCDAKGKMWSLFRLFAIEDGYALLLPKSGAEQALSEIKKYSVFSKVTIEMSTDAILGIWNSGELNPQQDVKAVTLEDGRTIVTGELAALEEYLSANSLPVVNEGYWQQMDLNAGLPRIDANNQNQHIPQALNLHALGGVSFDKGCYTGQETVARAKYRGTNKRALFTVVGALPADAKPPFTLERAVGENWRSAGDLIECVVQDGKAIGTIILASDSEPDQALRLVDSHESWQIKPLPYSIDG